MELQLSGIGPIKRGAIKLNGLTVLAGHNDSGKSTIGKLLFALTKAISRYEEDLKEERESEIEKIVESIYFKLKRYEATTGSLNQKIKAPFTPSTFLKDLEIGGVQAVEERERIVKQSLKKGEEREKIVQLLNKIAKIVGQSNREYRENAIKEALNRVFISEFENGLVNWEKKQGRITIREGDSDIAKISIRFFQNRYWADLKLQRESLMDLQASFFKDGTFIETPLILNYHEALANAKSYFEIRTKTDRLRRLGEPNVQLHTRDLSLKLRERVYGERENFRKIEKKIEQIINGQIFYDRRQEEFIFKKKEKRVKINNTASGVKSFGIIQMLLRAGFLEERTLLIIDEPEVHLHPVWQLKYAELIVNLVKEVGVTAVITSHNPYIVDALNLYSQLYQIEGLTNFYLVEDGIVEEAEVGAIFKSLGDPIQQLRQLRYSLKSKKLKRK